MSGIIAVFGNDVEGLSQQVAKMAEKIRHRGPDWSGTYQTKKAILVQERLAIMDPTVPTALIKSKDGKLILVGSNSIFNYLELRTKVQDNYDFMTHLDSEVILALYKLKGLDFFEDLNGTFAFALYDEAKDAYLIARDHLGITSLYIGWDDKSDVLYVASELKALEATCQTIEQFKPGHYFYSKEKKFVRWYKRDWAIDCCQNSKQQDANTASAIPNKIQYNYENDTKTGEMTEDDDKNNAKIDAIIKELRSALEKAVQRQLIADVPYGVFLSGDLESSIIAALTNKYARKRAEPDGKETDAWWPRLHSFAIGLRNSPDLEEARNVADHIGCIHHEFHFTLEEAIETVRDAIYHIETYDVTTVRASIPIFILARYVRSMGMKMVLLGGGSNEIFGENLDFHKAPNAKSLYEEIVRKLNQLHMYGCLRDNKTFASRGVERRVPFLDKQFLDVAMKINPSLKMPHRYQTGGGEERIDKWLLRKAFEDLLPENLVWRQKEQFPDGTGCELIDKLKEMTSEAVSDEDMSQASQRFPMNTPCNKEEYYYRSIFEAHFPSPMAAATVPSSRSVACCTT